MLRRTLLLLPAIALAAAVPGGCGNSRTPVPSLARPAMPNGFRTVIYPGGDLELDAPRNWSISTQHAPLLGTIISGSATVAVWRYVRPRPAPAQPSLSAQLQAARASLVASVRARASGTRLIRVRTPRLAGLPAIVLDATERIGGRTRRVRSIHLFAPQLELVVEEYAPPGIFHSVDRAVFSPLKRSLRLIYPPTT